LKLHTYCSNKSYVVKLFFQLEVPITEPQIKILILEDNEEDFRELEELLKRLKGLNITFDWAQDFNDGLRVLKEHNYDVCLLDSSLGSRGGLEFIRESKANEIKTPIIFLGERSERDVTALRAGAADYLVKGRIHPVFLRRAIRYALERSRSEQSYVTRQHENDEDISPLLSLSRNLEEQLVKVVGLLKIAQDKLKNQAKTQFILDETFKNALSALTLSSNLLRQLNHNDILTSALNIQELLLKTTSWLKLNLPRGISISYTINRKQQFLINAEPQLLKQLLIAIITYFAELAKGNGLITINLSQGENSAYVTLTITVPSVTLTENKFNFSEQTNTLESLIQTAIPSILQAHYAWYNLSHLNDETGTVLSLNFPAATLPSPALSLPKRCLTAHKGEILVVEADGSFAGLTQLYLDAAGVKSKVFKLELSNAPIPMLFTLFGMVMLVNPEQP